jgi:hypothetical protein
VQGRRPDAGVIGDLEKHRAVYSVMTEGRIAGGLHLAINQLVWTRE